MGPTKQDVVTIVENAKNRMLERVALKQDVQSIVDSIRTLTAAHQQTQQLLRQAEYQRVQLIRRAVALESRMATLEQEVRGYREVLKQRPAASPQVVYYAPPPQEVNDTGQQGQYLYRPA